MGGNLAVVIAPCEDGDPTVQGAMSRTPQLAAPRGSLKWIQRATNEGWRSLDDPILAALPGAQRIEWLSPLEADNLAEYQDCDFLERLGRGDLCSALQDFWPARGPQWDPLGRTDGGHLLLVEAKAHIAEMCSPGTAATASSRERIEARLSELATRLGARQNRAAWTDFFYQLANRIAHLDFLRTQGASAYLVLVNFLNDPEMKGPSSPEAWEAAYEVAFHVMGLQKRNPLAPYILEVYPDVGGRA